VRSHTCASNPGNRYYRYRGGYGVDPEYPRPLSVWTGVQRPVNAVLQYDGVTYFFSGADYQAFDDSTLTVSFAVYLHELVD